MRYKNPGKFGFFFKKIQIFRGREVVAIIDPDLTRLARLAGEAGCEAGGRGY